MFRSLSSYNSCEEKTPSLRLINNPTKSSIYEPIKTAPKAYSNLYTKDALLNQSGSTTRYNKNDFSKNRFSRSVVRNTNDNYSSNSSRLDNFTQRLNANLNRNSLVLDYENADNRNCDQLLIDRSSKRDFFEENSRYNDNNKSINNSSQAFVYIINSYNQIKRESDASSVFNNRYSNIGSSSNSRAKSHDVSISFFKKL
jgi:hypothetical protein